MAMRGEFAAIPLGAWYVLGVATIALQRIGIPVVAKSLPIVALLLVLVLGACAAKGISRVRDLRLVGYAMTVAFATGMTIVLGGSPTSLLLLALLWIPYMFLGPPGSSNEFLRGVLHSTLAACAFGALQSLVSAAGGGFMDPVSQLPKALLVPGFNTTYAVQYGSSWMKANGGVFLEPSLLSLFGGLALVLLVEGSLQLPRWCPRPLAILVAGAGVASSVAVSALVLAPALLIALFTLARRSWVMILETLVLIAILGLLPQAQPFLDRALAGEGTSNSARLINPYSILLPRAMGESPIVGLGAGASRIAVESLELGGGSQRDWQADVTTPTIVKTGYEFGLIGWVLLAAALITLWRRSPQSIASKAAIFSMYLIPTDGLSSALLTPLILISSGEVREPPGRTTPSGADDE